MFDFFFVGKSIQRAEIERARSPRNHFLREIFPTKNSDLFTCVHTTPRGLSQKNQGTIPIEKPQIFSLQSVQTR